MQPGVAMHAPRQPIFPLFQYFARNPLGTDYLCGDIHGDFDQLKKLMTLAGVNLSRDRIFAPGDNVDRHPDSIKAVEWIGNDWFFSGRGNHDQAAINVAYTGEVHERYASEGGEWFLKLPQNVREAVADVFLTLPFAMEVGTDLGATGIVHAAAMPNWWDTKTNLIHWHTLSESQKKYLYHKCLWSRSKFDTMDPSRIENIDRVFVGHKAVPEILTLGNTTYLDTGCMKGGHLTLIDLNDPGRVFTLPNPPIYVPRPKPALLKE